MDLKSEYKSYLEFMENYFPRSSMSKQAKVEKIKEIIHFNFKAIKVLDIYFHIDSIDIDTKKLINDLRFYFMRLLYILPTNDYFFIDVVLRAMSENLLRIVYISTHENLTYNDVISCNYRKLWKEGIKTTNAFQIYNHSLSNVNRIFGSKSSTIHSSQNEYDNQIKYLVNIMENDTVISIKQLKSDIKSMFDFLYSDLFSILNLRSTDLTMQQSASLNGLS